MQRYDGSIDSYCWHGEKKLLIASPVPRGASTSFEGWGEAGDIASILVPLNWSPGWPDLYVLLIIKHVLFIFTREVMQRAKSSWVWVLMASWWLILQTWVWNCKTSCKAGREESLKWEIAARPDKWGTATLITLGRGGNFGELHVIVWMQESTPSGTPYSYVHLCPITSPLDPTCWWLITMNCLCFSASWLPSQT